MTGLVFGKLLLDEIVGNGHRVGEKLIQMDRVASLHHQIVFPSLIPLFGASVIVNGEARDEGQKGAEN